MNQGTFELLKAFVRLFSEDLKDLQSVVNLIFDLGSVQVVIRGPDGKPKLKPRSEASQAEIQLILCAERYLRNRSDYSKAKVEQLICKNFLP